MEQINIGGLDVKEPIKANDVCILCDYDPRIVIRPLDVCTCCDALDWFKKDA